MEILVITIFLILFIPLFLVIKKGIDESWKNFNKTPKIHQTTTKNKDGSTTYTQTIIVD